MKDPMSPGFDDLCELAATVGAELSARGWRLATAESCTGGLVSAAVTAIGGSSGWFDRGFVTYSNAAKSELLGVSPGLLDRIGAVSAETARAMALGAMDRSAADIAVAITGIAGPTGGTPAKPVGTVWFGLGWRVGGLVHTATRHALFFGDRTAIRLQAAQLALRWVGETAGTPAAPAG